jgi:hypothetical protein
MNKKWKVIVIALITALVLTMSLAAQESNTAKATAGLFGTDVDDYMSYHWYSGVEFDKYFGFTGYNSPEDFGLSWGTVGIGYARRFGGIYLGAYYNGNIAANVNNNGSNWNSGHNTDTETIDAVYDANGNLYGKTTTTAKGGNGVYSQNDVSLLLGIAGMGFKVGFKENIITRETAVNTEVKTETPSASTITYNNELDSASYIKGDIVPSIGWGMGLDVGSLSIRPYVDAEVGFHQENDDTITKYYTIDTNTGKVRGALVSNSAGQGANYVAPNFALGADVTFLKKDGLEASAGLKYGIGFKIYANNYDVFGTSGTIAGTAAWLSSRTVTETADVTTTVNNVGLSISEKTAIDHVIKPSFTITKEIDERLKLGFNTGIGITIGTSSDKAYTEAKSETSRKFKNGVPNANLVERTTILANQNLTETTSFSIAPEFNAGTSFQLVPNRFHINAGVGLGFGFSNEVERITPEGYDYTDSHIEDANGNISDTTAVINTSQRDEQTVTQGWNGLSGGVSAGFTFFFNPKFTVDASWYTQSYNVNLGNVSILFTLKN